jgi:uncharacterized protein (DUF608 family)
MESKRPAGDIAAGTDDESRMARRKFLKLSAFTAGSVGAASGFGAGCASPVKTGVAQKASVLRGARNYNGPYTGEFLNQVAFPMGGIGAGMICLEGTGALSHVSLRNHPDVFNEPCIVAALALQQAQPAALVIEGPVPARKIFGPPGSGDGLGGRTYGLPRFKKSRFEARFPFGAVHLTDEEWPVEVELTGWSPFEPGDADNACLPVAALEYRFTNRGAVPQDAVFSFNCKNFMAIGDNAQAVRPIDGGFFLWCGGSTERPWEEGAFSATVSEPAVKVNCAWFRGGWWDPLTMAWRDVARGACFESPPPADGDPSPGATLFVPFRLAPGESRTIALCLAWYVGQTNLKQGNDPEGAPPAYFHRPWYAGRFAGIEEVTAYWRDHYDDLRSRTRRFSDCFYDSTAPAEVLEAVAANFCILKSPTILRQTDGKLWGWEGCNDPSGCCEGSCTHVWNYAQSIAHLFPNLERTLRETEFGPSQNEAGHQTFRSALPIRPVEHGFHAASDGQLGGIMKVYRDWRISGDTEWLRALWPKVKRSLDYCIETWDPRHEGMVEEPHHNTYDIEFWGPDGMITSFYLGALQAAIAMGEALGDEVPLYSRLLKAGTANAQTKLFDGEYFVQRIQWQGLRAEDPTKMTGFGGGYSPEALAILAREGPKYQYGIGCLSDGVLGSWLALVCGVGQVLDPAMVSSHLRAVYRYNLKQDLSDFADPQRPSYACGAEGGLLLCTWPKGGQLSLPFPYSNEVWTGIEYQSASHMMRMGMVNEGLAIVRTCRDSYDGRVRNPFDEYECGHWYARAMSSYALLFGLSGARYDAVDKVLYLQPSIKGDFRCFFSTATSYGTVGVRDGKPFYEAKSGTLDIREIKYT